MILVSRSCLPIRIKLTIFQPYKNDKRRQTEPPRAEPPASWSGVSHQRYGKTPLRASTVTNTTRWRDGQFRKSTGTMGSNVSLLIGQSRPATATGAFTPTSTVASNGRSMTPHRAEDGAAVVENIDVLVPSTDLPANDLTIQRRATCKRLSTKYTIANHGYVQKQEIPWKFLLLVSRIHFNVDKLLKVIFNRTRRTSNPRYKSYRHLPSAHYRGIPP